MHSAKLLNKENFFYYKEKSTIDYKVKLKENNFYDVEYLEKDMLYVASLIDSIDIDFKYDFLSEQNIDINFEIACINIYSLVRFRSLF